MGQLPTYVDMMDYCNELCVITNLEFYEVEPIVNAAFVFIHDGKINAIQGFLLIENLLNTLMNTKDGKSLALTM